MLPLGMEDVHGPEEVMKGVPLNVATPFSSVKRFCIRNNIISTRFFDLWNSWIETKKERPSIFIFSTRTNIQRDELW